jgi:hypothetical protein
MPTMINRGKEMIRICPSNPAKLEFSTSSGRSWNPKYCGDRNVGQFIDLMDNGKEILGTTTKGLFFSVSEGRSWVLRKK